jgi:hypothetical protein
VLQIPIQISSLGWLSPSSGACILMSSSEKWPSGGVVLSYDDILSANFQISIKLASLSKNNIFTRQAWSYLDALVHRLWPLQHVLWLCVILSAYIYIGKFQTSFGQKIAIFGQTESWNYILNHLNIVLRWYSSIQMHLGCCLMALAKQFCLVRRKWSRSRDEIKCDI